MTIDQVDEKFATEFAARFADTWRTPDLAKHEALWSDDIVLIQPMMGTLHGKQACRESFQRLFALVPDLHADVHRVGYGKHEVFIEFALSGTYGGKPMPGMPSTASHSPMGWLQNGFRTSTPHR
jgi:hypothetical protein